MEPCNPWFKLLLLDDNDLPEEVRNSVKIREARAYLEKHNITTLEAITIFLRRLWNHAIRRIAMSQSMESLVKLPSAAGGPGKSGWSAGSLYIHVAQLPHLGRAGIPLSYDALSIQRVSGCPRSCRYLAHV